MRRIDYQGEEYLIHTRSGMPLKVAMEERGIPVDCDCATKESSGKCEVKWPKDTAFLLTAPTSLERSVLGEKVDKGFRLACQAMFK